MKNRPYYQKLYADMIRDKYPHKASICKPHLERERWTALDVIKVNELLFGSEKQKSDVRMDKKHRSYDIPSIIKILEYQQKNQLSNIQLAKTFGMSKNSVAKWQKLFPEVCEAT